MADLFDEVKKYCESFGDFKCEKNGKACQFDRSEPYKPGCRIDDITGKKPMHWDENNRDVINKALDEQNINVADDNAGYSTSQKHYITQSPIEFMQTLMSKEMFIGFCIGNTIKYLARAPFKGQYASDINKARQYSWWASVARKGKKVNPSEPVPKDFKTRVFIC